MKPQTQAPEVAHTPDHWSAVKYPDCKTWTVFAPSGTVASKMTQEHAEQIAREHNSHAALVEACEWFSANADRWARGDVARGPAGKDRDWEQRIAALRAALSLAHGTKEVQS